MTTTPEVCSLPTALDCQPTDSQVEATQAPQDAQADAISPESSIPTVAELRALLAILDRQSFSKVRRTNEKKKNSALAFYLGHPEILKAAVCVA